jgi:hypothetical protein
MILSGTTCPGATYSTTNPTWTDLGMGPRLRGKRAATFIAVLGALSAAKAAQMTAEIKFLSRCQAHLVRRRHVQRHEGSRRKFGGNGQGTPRFPHGTDPLGTCSRPSHTLATTVARLIFKKKTILQRSMWHARERPYFGHVAQRAQIVSYGSKPSYYPSGSHNYSRQTMRWSLRGVNILSAVRGQYRACRWTEDSLLVSAKVT